MRIEMFFQLKAEVDHKRLTHATMLKQNRVYLTQAMFRASLAALSPLESTFLISTEIVFQFMLFFAIIFFVHSTFQLLIWPEAIDYCTLTDFLSQVAGVISLAQVCYLISRFYEFFLCKIKDIASVWVISFTHLQHYEAMNSIKWVAWSLEK